MKKSLFISAIVVCLLPFVVNGQNAPCSAFRDLNKNGRMDIYEDISEPIEKRVNDLLRQMTLEEKAGLMFFNFTIVNLDGTIEEKPSPGLFSFAPAVKMITEKKMSHFNLSLIPKVTDLARWYNALQKFAEGTRLGIPVTIASDPRHGLAKGPFKATKNEFSEWCDLLGFAAIGDEDFTRRFADIVRQEYMAVGIREALHPSADLASEPRWALISNTFGEDASLASKMVVAYLEGMQRTNVSNNSVACMTKHFPGAGPQKEGLDSHFDIQKYQVYPSDNLNYHLMPFRSAIKANTAAIMNYYAIPKNQTKEQVGISYNKEMVQQLLRNKYKYDGIVCTDWGIVTDAMIGPYPFKARAWGVENLSIEERVAKIIEAGCDMIGGEKCPEIVVKLVQENRIKEARINISVKRILRQKFQLGLFDCPYIDEAKVTEIVGKQEFRTLGEKSQRMSMTLLKNDSNTLPLAIGKHKIFLINVDSALASKYATVVSDYREADFAIMRLRTPYYPVNTNPVANILRLHEGDLDFKGEEKELVMALLKAVPTIVDIYLDRPAVIPDINSSARALLANFGANDQALLDVIFGKDAPVGNLPFELPSSMEAVYQQKEDKPYDSAEPLFKFGFGLRYK